MGYANPVARCINLDGIWLNAIETYSARRIATYNVLEHVTARIQELKVMPIRAAAPVIVLLAITLQSCASSSTDGAQSESPAAVAPSAAAIPVTEVIENAISATVTPDSLTTVAVNNFEGIILITGQVLSEDEKSKVSNAVAFSAGRQLRRLSNELRVVEQIDTSISANDANLATAANDLLATAAPSVAEQTEAVVENAVVYLIGRVTRAQGDEAGHLVSGLEGIASVKVVFDYTD
jgi:osmotically-inducible protein OsmY